MKKINIFLILFMALVITSCQSVKNALTGAKQENSDEFLVQKKNPLTMPPDFEKLPEPGSLSVGENKKNDNEDNTEID